MSASYSGSLSTQLQAYSSKLFMYAFAFAMSIGEIPVLALLISEFREINPCFRRRITPVLNVALLPCRTQIKQYGTAIAQRLKPFDAAS